ncbi:MAG TPA: PBP1A family penicillin-binding protein [Pyrinomonadaceae bacterium]
MAVVSVAFVASLVYCYRGAAETVDRRLAAGYLTSRAGLYAAPRVLRAGQNFSRERLVETLRRAGYVEQSASDVWSGAFSAKADGAIEINPRRASVVEHDATETTKVNFTPEAVRVEFDGRGRIREITGDGVTLEAFALEPEALTNDAAEKNGTRTTLAYADIPPVVVNAIRAIEDRRFFEHHGLDVTGIGRALLSWTGGDTGGGAPERQGGSTITQQLVKNTYLTPERTLRRKFDEALLAAALERRLSKEDIFALYCNEIYLGQRGAFAVRGVKQAARVYFGKDLGELSLGEAATIAGMIQSPARYAPDRQPGDARRRRDAVLAAMLRDNSITAEEARAATGEEIKVAPADGSARAVAPYFVDYVNRAVEAQLRTSDTHADERSLRVYTTIDLDLQQMAEQTIARGLARLERKGASADRRPQAALVALDAQTGHVLALVGGRSYGESQLNRATDARRQPGSVFKPIVYAAALERGISPVQTFADAPRAFTFDRHGAPYRPANYGGGYSMRNVTMREALTKSLNVVTVDLAMQTGLERVAALAETFGLQKSPAYPSLALGTTEATPLEIASAYTAFANEGTRARPSAVLRAIDGTGVKLLEEFLPSTAQVVQPSTAYMITDMLANVLEEGTARAARGMLKVSAVAGKTGTSRDGWFAGYTPRIVCVVWVGFDDNAPLGLTGAESALPVWEEFMRGALQLRPELGGAAFLRPAGIETVEIDALTGQLATPSCPARERIAVTPALAPNFECLTHQTIFSTLATNGTEQQLLASPTTTNAPPVDPSSRTAVASRTHFAHNADAPVALHAPSIQTTRTEQQRDGRPRLTNDPQINRQ